MHLSCPLPWLLEDGVQRLPPSLAAEVPPSLLMTLVTSTTRPSPQPPTLPCPLRGAVRVGWLISRSAQFFRRPTKPAEMFTYYVRTRVRTQTKKKKITIRSVRSVSSLAHSLAFLWDKLVHQKNRRKSQKESLGHPTRGRVSVACPPGDPERVDRLEHVDNVDGRAHGAHCRRLVEQREPHLFGCCLFVRGGGQGRQTATR